MRKATRRVVTTSLMVTPLSIVAATGTALAAGPGPNTTTSPYLVPAPGAIGAVDFTSLLTVNDSDAADNGYEMVGIPDGLGARPLGNGNVEVHMNHELGATAGAVRAHGEKGAFISKWEINPATDQVVSGADAIQLPDYYDFVSGGRNTTGVNSVFSGGVAATKRAFDRFCSSDMAPVSAFYNASSGLGYQGQIYLTGEEVGDEARLFGLDVTEGLGKFRQIERAGMFSWENAVASPAASDKTLVLGLEDGANGASELWMYEGTKTNTGDNFDKAGLTNGLSYALRVITNPSATDTETEFRTNFGKNNPVAVEWVGINWNQSGTAQNSAARAANALGLNRIEDGQFDPQNPNDFYFVTTTDPGGLWRLRFNDVTQGIASGATLTLVLDGSEIPANPPTDVNTNPSIHTPDNMTIDDAGHILIQEDPGNVAHIARILAYEISTTKLASLADFTGGPYTPTGGPVHTTSDEESSGIIPFNYVAQPSGTGTFLLDTQIHRPPSGWPTDLVEGGQMLKMSVNWNRIFGPEAEVSQFPMLPLVLLGMAVVGGGVLVTQRRRPMPA